MGATDDEQCPLTHLLHSIADSLVLLLVGDADKTGEVYDLEAL